MKANKKTLMAVKKYLEEPEGYDMDEVISDIINDTKMLKYKEDGKNYSADADECDIKWGDEQICNLDDFINEFSEKFIENICNVLDSFVGEDISYYFEDEEYD